MLSGGFENSHFILPILHHIGEGGWPQRQDLASHDPIALVTAMDAAAADTCNAMVNATNATNGVLRSKRSNIAKKTSENSVDTSKFFL